MSKKKMPRTIKNVIRGLPLAGAAASVLLPLHQFAQQFMVLIVLVWVQAFFLLEVLLAGK